MIWPRHAAQHSMEHMELYSSPQDGARPDFSFNWPEPMLPCLPSLDSGLLADLADFTAEWQNGSHLQCQHAAQPAKRSRAGSMLDDLNFEGMASSSWRSWPSAREVRLQSCFPLHRRGWVRSEGLGAQDADRCSFAGPPRPGLCPLLDWQLIVAANLTCVRACDRVVVQPSCQSERATSANAAEQHAVQSGASAAVCAAVEAPLTWLALQMSADLALLRPALPLPAQHRRSCSEPCRVAHRARPPALNVTIQVRVALCSSCTTKAQTLTARTSQPAQRAWAGAIAPGTQPAAAAQCTAASSDQILPPEEPTEAAVRQQRLQTASDSAGTACLCWQAQCAAERGFI